MINKTKYFTGDGVHVWVSIPTMTRCKYVVNTPPNYFIIIGEDPAIPWLYFLNFSNSTPMLTTCSDMYFPL